MKCFHCGAEIEDGSITCSHCGNPLEVVTDLFGDNDVLVEHAQTEVEAENTADDSDVKVVLGPEVPPETPPADPETEPGEDGEKPDMIEKKKMYIILGIVSGVFIILLILMAIFWRKPKEVIEEVVEEEVGYEDVVNLISDSINSKNYGIALDSCAQALTFGECDEYFIYKRYLEIYRALDNEDKCLETLTTLKEYASTTGLPDELTDWYEGLLSIYARKEDTLSVGTLINEIEDTFIAVDKTRLLQPFTPADPVFSEVPDPAYPGDRIFITSPDGSNIFMGKVSKKEGSEPYLALYHGQGIQLKAGRNEYAAVCENQYGLKSSTVNFSYVLKTVYDVDMPVISPESGEYREESYVEIDVPYSYKVYYCWDGDPDTESSVYTEKIEMKEGNHVFSAIMEDKYGNISNIQRVNYIYIPEKEPEEEEEEPEKSSDDKKDDSGKGKGSNIIKDADDTPEYHGRVKDPDEDKDKDDTGKDDDTAGNTVSGNDAVSENGSSSDTQ